MGNVSTRSELNGSWPLPELENADEHGGLYGVSGQWRQYRRPDGSRELVGPGETPTEGAVALPPVATP